MFDPNKVDELNSAINKIEKSLSSLETRLQSNSSDTFLARMNQQMKRTIEYMAKLQDEYKDLTTQLGQAHQIEMRGLWEKRKAITKERDEIRQRIAELKQESELRKYVGEYQNNPKAYEAVKRRMRKLEEQERRADVKAKKQIEEFDVRAARTLEGQNKRMQEAIRLKTKLGQVADNAGNLGRDITKEQQRRLQQVEADKELRARLGLGAAFGVNAGGLGTFVGKIQQFTSAFSTAVKYLGLFNTSIISLVGIIGSLLLSFGLNRIKDRLEAYSSLRKSGFGTNLSNELVNTGEESRNQALQQYGVNLSRAQVSEIQSGISNSLGSASLATANFTASIGNLTKGYFASTESATRFASALLRNNKFQEQTAINGLNLIEKFGVGSRVSVSQLTETLASNTDILARSTDKTGESMIRAAINANRLGVALGSFESLANRLVDDFESSLMLQAELQAFLPGLDLSELMYASQFGSSEQIQNALRGALGGTGMTDTSQLPRSLQNKLSSSLGMGLTEINNILGGPSTGEAIARTDAATEGMDKFAKTVDTSVMNLGAFNGALDAAVRKLYLGPTSASSGGRAISESFASRHSGGYIGGRGGMQTRSVSPSVFSGAPRFHDGLMPNEVPAILQTGEAVLSRSQLSGLSNLMQSTVILGEMGQSVSVNGPTNISSREMIQKFSSIMNNESTVSSVSNSAGSVEGKLDELISVIRNMGITIDLDGKKVGTGVVEAFSRAS